MEMMNEETAKRKICRFGTGVVTIVVETGVWHNGVASNMLEIKVIYVLQHLRLSPD